MTEQELESRLERPDCSEYPTLWLTEEEYQTLRDFMSTESWHNWERAAIQERLYACPALIGGIAIRVEGWGLKLIARTLTTAEKFNRNVGLK